MSERTRTRIKLAIIALLLATAGVAGTIVGGL